MNFRTIISAIAILLSGSAVYAQTIIDTLKTKELKEVTISGTVNTYKQDSSAMLTRMPMKIIEIPQQIQVVSRSLMNDQQSFILQDVLKNSSGVIAAGVSAPPKLVHIKSRQKRLILTSVKNEKEQIHINANCEHSQRV